MITKVIATPIGTENIVQELTEQELVEYQNKDIKYAEEKKILANEEIKRQLEIIDTKSIRALRSDDKLRLNQLEAEASELRAKLLPLE